MPLVVRTRQRVQAPISGGRKPSMRLAERFREMARNRGPHYQTHYQEMGLEGSRLPGGYTQDGWKRSGDGAMRQMGGIV